VPRQGYLYTVIPKIIPFWQHLLPPEVSNTPWFSYNSLPLKWNIPTGVLFDLLLAGFPSSHPWQLTLHFTDFPTATLGEYTGEDSLKSIFRNSLKEASFIAKNSAQPVMDMVVGAREDHFKTFAPSITGNGGRNYHKYKEIMHSIPLISPDSLDSVPVRVYLRPGSVGTTYLSSYESITCTSRPVPVFAADGQPTTLGGALTPIIHAWLIDHRKESGTVAAGEGEEEKNEIKAAWSQIDVALGGGSGVELHPELILRDLHRDLCSIDFFLYFVLHMQPTTQR
jgi:autophagy-related protein 5